MIRVDTVWGGMQNHDVPYDATAIVDTYVNLLKTRTENNEVDVQLQPVPLEKMIKIYIKTGTNRTFSLSHFIAPLKTVIGNRTLRYQHEVMVTTEPGILCVILFKYVLNAPQNNQLTYGSTNYAQIDSVKRTRPGQDDVQISSGPISIPSDFDDTPTFGGFVKDLINPFSSGAK